MLSKISQFYRAFKEDFETSKDPGEDFLAWLLIRKLTFAQKMLLSFLLWFFWLSVWTHPMLFIYLLGLSLLAAGVTLLVHWRKKKS